MNKFQLGAFRGCPNSYEPAFQIFDFEVFEAFVRAGLEN
jgi:hypothetical protein